MGIALLLALSSLSGIGAVAQEKPDIQALMNRTVGQTVFYAPAPRRMAIAAAAGLESAPSATRSGGAVEQREIQDSDVFKIGPQGSKLLYVLNNYRGLQAIRFSEKDGKLIADLVGREEATGNYPADMYYVPSTKKLLVLERIYFDRQNGAYSEDQSRIVVYDVSKPEKPTKVDQIPFKGDLSDSRIVGDVLYVGSKVTPNWYQRNSNETAKGYVTSFDLSGKSVTQINQLEFSAPLTYRENMNIIEVPQKDGGFKYYLAAVTQAWRTDWREPTRNFVELVDITDPKGQIHSVMRVPAKGEIQKRSQLILKDQALIVVSNYAGPTPAGGSQWSRIQRVAVETFLLPQGKDKTIDTAEAEYRKLWREREIRNLGPLSEDELKNQTVTIDSDPDSGLKGVFVKNDKGVLEKPFPDFFDSRGDTTGLSAVLKDVRVDGDLMYVSWVPANRIDPVDLYKLDKIETAGPTYLNRTQFDGWIERSIPLTYKGRQFLLALGYIIPSDSQRQTRKFQAILFEMVTKRGKIQPEIVSQIALSESGGYSNFNQADKLVEVKFSAEGQGQVLFSQSTYAGKKWVSGGKLVHFDLSQADSDAEKVFSEGAFLEGSGGYLRRIFNNPETGRINSFSDLALATYAPMAARADKSGFVKAASFLELARNIRAYVVAGTKTKARGIQIVTSGNSWFDYSQESKTELRFVGLDQADAEVHETMQRLELQGAYSSHVLLSETQLVVTTTQSEYKDDQYIETRRVYRVDVGAKTPKVLDSPVTWVTDNDMYSGFWRGMYRHNRANEILKVSDKEIIVQAGQSLRQIQFAKGAMQVHAYTLPAGTADKPREETSALMLDNKLYLFVSESNGQEDPSGYTQNFLIPLTLKDGKAVLGTAINIPGRPLGLSGNKLVTSDEWAVDSVEQTRKAMQGQTWTEWIHINRRGLLSLEMQATQAVLRDIDAANQNVTQTWTPLADGSFISVINPSTNNGYGYGYYGYDSHSTHEMHFLSVNSDFKFAKEVRALPLSTSAPQNVNAVHPSAKNPGQLIAVLTSWTGLRLVQWDPKALRPESVPVTDDPAQEGCEAFLHPGMNWWYSDYTVSYSPKGDVLQLPLGLAGVKTVYVK